MSLSDVRFVKGMLFGILSMVGDSVPLLVHAGLAAIGIAYMVASIFTKQSTP